MPCFFFVTGVRLFVLRVVDGRCPCFEFRGRDAVGEVHEREVERLAIVLRCRRDAAPEEGAEFGERVRGDVGDFLPRLTLEAEHCPHRGATGECFAVHYDFYLAHTYSAPCFLPG